MLQGKALIRATMPFAKEERARSWWHLWSTLTVLLVLLAIGAAPLAWWTRLAASVLGGLVLCRLFIIYHDQQHGSILRHSRLADALMWTYGVLALNPASTWNASHNHHHSNNARIRSAAIGSFPVMTTDTYARASRTERWGYAIVRHPLTIALAMFTVFVYGMTLRSLLRNPSQHLDCAIAILLHVLIWVVLAMHAPGALLFSFVLPFAIAGALGAYLFYAQHNFPAVDLGDQGRWDYVFAALHSSSCLDASPMMHWFTGNIGYHHVHHLNSRIPFYRLPQVMAALPELQNPGRISLSLASIIACFRLKLWDEKKHAMVGFDGK